MATPTAPSRDDRPVIWTLSVSRLSNLLRDVIPEFDGRARIESLHIGFDAAVRELRRRLVHEDCDVIIAAGSNGAWLRSRIDLPVVLIRPSGFDLMNALTQARRLAPRIGVITHEHELPAFSHFQRSFGLDVAQRTFITEEDARGCVAELASLGVGAIVGTGMVTDLAEKAGVAGVLLYSPDSVRSAFEQALDLARMLDDGPGRPTATGRPRRASDGSGARYRLDDLLGDSPPMQRLRRDIAQLAERDASVLISGETGTGKELAAQALHNASPRRGGPFQAVNCGALAESLLESELFGHEEGAFTGSRRGGRKGLFEAADGGSLFLDEIGEMPLPLQTRLLRVIEEREVTRVGGTRRIPVDLRLIAASHCDLPAMVADGRFRRDLYYRLDVLRLRMPPLREHREDIPALATHFLRQITGPRPVPTLGDDALAALAAHDWPGNVRELRNVIERLAVLSDNARIDATAVHAALPGTVPMPASPAVVPHTVAPSRKQRPAHTDLRVLLEAHGGDRSRLAESLGVSRTTLWRWLRD